MNTIDDWWLRFYDAKHSLFTQNSNKHDFLEASVDFLSHKLKLDTRHKLYDQCCGKGELTRRFAQRHIPSLGVDVQEHLIQTAERSSTPYGLPCTFQVADATSFVPPQKMSAVINWGTSFAVSPDDHYNRLFLQRAYESLREGGYLALDTINLSFLLDNFQTHRIQRHATVDGLLLSLQDIELDLERGLIIENRAFHHPNGRCHERRRLTKMYPPHRIHEILTRTGFTNIQTYGSVRGEALTRKSERSIFIARKG